jgi:nucleoside-diphosphate-sugar epimerase
MGGGACAGSKLMSTLLALGLGYCARHYVIEFGDRFTHVVGTTRSAQGALSASIRSRGRSVEMLVFDGISVSQELAEMLPQVDALLISAAPADGRDPALTALGPQLQEARQLRAVVYLSSLGVYADSGGAWIDESAPTLPEFARRGSARIDAEQAWQALGARRGFPVAILRLGGIYGPGRTGMVRLLRGNVQRIVKRAHVSNRIHVSDVAQAIDAAFARRADGVFNVVDDEPAPPSDQIAFAAELLGMTPPPEIPYAQAPGRVSPFALSFYDGCIRARNDKLKSVLGVELRYPNYRVGLRALHAAGDHRAVASSSASTGN